MAGRLAALAAIQSLILVSCSSGVAPTRSEGASPGPSQGPSAPSTIAPPPATAAPVPVATPTPAAAATTTTVSRTLGPDQVATVVTNDLVIRSKPGISKRSVGYKPYLGRREQVFVLGGSRPQNARLRLSASRTASDSW